MKLSGKNIIAADFGAPTKRERLFLIARCDGQPIVWPEKYFSKKPKGNLKNGAQQLNVLIFQI